MVILFPILQKKYQIWRRPGPTAFVKVAWILFGIIGVAYILLLHLLFPENPFIVTIALLFKIFLFLSLGQFYMLLAPGYHWFRDIIIILIPYLTIQLQNAYLNKNIYSKRELASIGIIVLISLLFSF